jgi:hypothetical protein
VAADSAGPALALAQTGHLDGVADTKNVGADFAADVEFFRDLVNAKFTNELRHDLGSLDMAGHALGQLLGRLGTDLDGGVAVFFGGLVLQDGIIGGRQQGHSLNHTVFRDGAGHADFACN